jgi:hypothetical protein
VRYHAISLLVALAAVLPGLPATAQPVDQPVLNQPGAVPRATSASPTPLNMRAIASPNEALLQAPVMGSKTKLAMAQGEPIDLKRFAEWRGTDARAHRFVTFVLRDAQDWEDFWNHQYMKMPDTLPRNRMAVAIMLGKRPPSGYYVRIVAINDLGNGSYNVLYEEIKPPGTPPRVDEYSSPWVVKLLPRTEGRVRFFSMTE